MKPLKTEELHKQIESEKELRRSLECQLHDATQSNNNIKLKVFAVEHELQRMEDQVRLYQCKVDEMKQERINLANTYESNRKKYQTQINILESDNMRLLNEVKKLESTIKSLRSSMDRVDLLEKLKHLESENASLLKDNESHKKEYDEISGHVVTALLGQKSLKDECSKLKDRIQELEIQNGQLTCLFQHQMRLSTDSLLHLQWYSDVLSPIKIDNQSAVHHEWIKDTCIDQNELGLSDKQERAESLNSLSCFIPSDSKTPSQRSSICWSDISVPNYVCSANESDSTLRKDSRVHTTSVTHECLTPCLQSNPDILSHCAKTKNLSTTSLKLDKCLLSPSVYSNMSVEKLNFARERIHKSPSLSLSQYYSEDLQSQDKKLSAPYGRCSWHFLDTRNKFIPSMSSLSQNELLSGDESDIDSVTPSHKTSTFSLNDILDTNADSIHESQWEDDDSKVDLLRENHGDVSPNSGVLIKNNSTSHRINVADNYYSLEKGQKSVSEHNKLLSAKVVRDIKTSRPRSLRLGCRTLTLSKSGKDTGSRGALSSDASVSNGVEIPMLNDRIDVKYLEDTKSPSISSLPHPHIHSSDYSKPYSLSSGEILSHAQIDQSVPTSTKSNSQANYDIVYNSKTVVQPEVQNGLISSVSINSLSRNSLAASTSYIPNFYSKYMISRETLPKPEHSTPHDIESSTLTNDNKPSMVSSDSSYEGTPADHLGSRDDGYSTMSGDVHPENAEKLSDSSSGGRLLGGRSESSDADVSSTSHQSSPQEKKKFDGNSIFSKLMSPFQRKPTANKMSNKLYKGTSNMPSTSPVMTKAHGPSIQKQSPSTSCTNSPKKSPKNITSSKLPSTPPSSISPTYPKNNKDSKTKNSEKKLSRSSSNIKSFKNMDSEENKKLCSDTINDHLDEVFEPNSKSSCDINTYSGVDINDISISADSSSRRLLMQSDSSENKRNKSISANLSSIPTFNTNSLVKFSPKDSATKVKNKSDSILHDGRDLKLLTDSKPSEITLNKASKPSKMEKPSFDKRISSREHTQRSFNKKEYMIQSNIQTAPISSCVSVSSHDSSLSHSCLKHPQKIQKNKPKIKNEVSKKPAQMDNYIKVSSSINTQSSQTYLLSQSKINSPVDKLHSSSHSVALEPVYSEIKDISLLNANKSISKYTTSSDGSSSVSNYKTSNVSAASRIKISPEISTPLKSSYKLSSNKTIKAHQISKPQFGWNNPMVSSKNCHKVNAGDLTLNTYQMSHAETNTNNSNSLFSPSHDKFSSTPCTSEPLSGKPFKGIKIEKLVTDSTNSYALNLPVSRKLPALPIQRKPAPPPVPPKPSWRSNPSTPIEPVLLNNFLRKSTTFSDHSSLNSQHHTNADSKSNSESNSLSTNTSCLKEVTLTTPANINKSRNCRILSHISVSECRSKHQPSLSSTIAKPDDSPATKTTEASISHHTNKISSLNGCKTLNLVRPNLYRCVSDSVLNVRRCSADCFINFRKTQSFRCLKKSRDVAVKLDTSLQERIVKIKKEITVLETPGKQRSKKLDQSIISFSDDSLSDVAKYEEQFREEFYSLCRVDSNFSFGSDTLETNLNPSSGRTKPVVAKDNQTNKQKPFDECNDSVLISRSPKEKAKNSVISQKDEFVNPPIDFACLSKLKTTDIISNLSSPFSSKESLQQFNSLTRKKRMSWCQSTDDFHWENDEEMIYLSLSSSDLCTDDEDVLFGNTSAYDWLTDNGAHICDFSDSSESLDLHCISRDIK